MSITTNLVIAVVVDAMFVIAISAAVYAVLNLVIWSWLAFILSMIASMFANGTAAVTTAKQHTYDAAVAGTAKVLGWWNARRAAEVTP